MTAATLQTCFSVRAMGKRFLHIFRGHQYFISVYAILYTLRHNLWVQGNFLIPKIASDINAY